MNRYVLKIHGKKHTLDTVYEFWGQIFFQDPIKKN